MHRHHSPIPPPDAKRHPGPFKAVHTQESMKVCDIRDAKNALRFKVCLDSFEQSDDFDGLAYEIFVINYFTFDEPTEISRIPEAGSTQRITDYYEALKIFDQQVRDFTALVKAETRDLQDIDVFKDKIEYELTCPKCCATCKWIQEDYLRKFWTDYKIASREPGFKERRLFRCTNPKCQGEFNFTRDLKTPPYEDPMCHHEDERHGHHHDEEHRGHHHHKPDIHLCPHVDIFGICKHYEYVGEWKFKDPEHSPWRFKNHDMNPSMRDETIIKYEVRNQINTQVVPIVGEAIDEKLNNNPPVIEGNRNISDYNSDGSISEEEQIQYDGGGAF